MHGSGTQDLLPGRGVSSALRGLTSISGLVALLIVVGSWSARAADGDAAIAGTRLVVRDGSSPKVEYRSTDRFGGITKGDGTDPGTISAEFFFTQAGNGGFGLTVPDGTFDGSSGWKKNDTRGAEYRNAVAPAGASPVRRASIKPDRRLQLSARGVGGFAFGGNETPVYTGYCVTNAGETFCHCSAFTDCTFDQSGDGTMLRCRRGGIDPGCRAVTDHKRAFTAQATSTFGEDRCIFDDDALVDVVSAMVNLGYDVSSGHFEIEVPDEESIPSTSRLVVPGQEALLSHFDDSGERSMALAPGDAVVFLTCTPSENTIWSYGALVDKIVQDENDPGVSRQASLGEVTLNATNATTDGPTPNMEKLLVVWTADQQTFDDVTQAVADAGILDLPTNLVPIEDLTIPDGNGGTVRTLTVDSGSYPQAQLMLRMLSVPPPGRTPFRLDRELTYPFIRFTPADPARTPVPVDATKNPFSPPHADLGRVSRNFDYLVKNVVRAFENLSFIHLQLVSDQPFVRQNGVDSTLGIPVSAIEGGGTCLADELDCGLDDPNSYYAWPGDTIPLGDDDYYVVIGLDYSNLTGLGGPMARSSRLLFYGYDDATGRFELPNDDFDVSSTPLQAFADPDDQHLPRPVDATFTGSLSRKARAVVPNAFMVPFARPQNCSDSLPSLCFDTDTLDDILLVSRLSFNPVTGTRPDPDQVIPWRLLHFQVVP